MVVVAFRARVTKRNTPQTNSGFLKPGSGDELVPYLAILTIFNAILTNKEQGAEMALSFIV
jgi:hypothetical protein